MAESATLERSTETLVGPSVLETIQSLLAGVDPAVALVPQGHKCAHYVELGVLEEDTKRIGLVLDRMNRDALTSVATKIGGAFTGLGELFGAGMPSGKQVKDFASGQLKQLFAKNDAADDDRTVGELLKALFYAEIVRQFPVLKGNTSSIVIGADGTVGYGDHSMEGLARHAQKVLGDDYTTYFDENGALRGNLDFEDLDDLIERLGFDVVGFEISRSLFDR